MKTFMTVLLLLVCSIISNGQKIDGKWKGTMKGPNGDFELTYIFKTNADSLNGTVESEMGSIPIENGKVNGNEFTFDVNVNGQIFKNTCAINGDTVTLKVPGMEQAMVLSRVNEKSKIDGKWVGTASSPQGDMELTFTFKVDGDSLTGTNSSPMGEIALTNGVVNGNEFSFDVDVQGMKISHKCKYLPDDTIDMKANVMDQEMDMKLKRLAE